MYLSHKTLTSHVFIWYLFWHWYYCFSTSIEELKETTGCHQILTSTAMSFLMQVISMKNKFSIYIIAKKGIRSCETQIFKNYMNLYALHNATITQLQCWFFQWWAKQQKGSTECPTRCGHIQVLKKPQTFGPSSVFNLLITTRDREARFPFLLEKCVKPVILLCHCHYLKSNYSYAY